MRSLLVKERQSREMELTNDGKLVKDGIEYAIGDSICFVHRDLLTDHKQTQIVKRSHKVNVIPP